MAGRLRLSRLAWPLLAVALGLASLTTWWWWGDEGALRGAWVAPPQMGAGQAWRWWSSALVHLNAAHLQANLWACAVVAAWGWTARLQPHHALAWLAAWPLSQALLVTDPGSLSRYVGLSATLHAGAAIGCWQLLVHERGARRAVGAAVALALSVKLVMEVPALQAAWAKALHAWGLSPAPIAPGWALAPLTEAPGHVVAGHAHGCGVLAGVVAIALVDGIIAVARPWRPRTEHPT